MYLVDDIISLNWCTQGQYYKITPVFCLTLNTHNSINIMNWLVMSWCSILCRRIARLRSSFWLFLPGAVLYKHCYLTFVIFFLVTFFIYKCQLVLQRLTLCVEFVLIYKSSSVCVLFLSYVYVGIVTESVMSFVCFTNLQWCNV